MTWNWLQERSVPCNFNGHKLVSRRSLTSRSLPHSALQLKWRTILGCIDWCPSDKPYYGSAKFPFPQLLKLNVDIATHCFKSRWGASDIIISYRNILWIYTWRVAIRVSTQSIPSNEIGSPTLETCYYPNWIVFFPPKKTTKQAFSEIFHNKHLVVPVHPIRKQGSPRACKLPPNNFLGSMQYQPYHKSFQSQYAPCSDPPGIREPFLIQSEDESRSTEEKFMPSRLFLMPSIGLLLY